jgi:hypothetical protein
MLSMIPTASMPACVGTAAHSNVLHERHVQSLRVSLCPNIPMSGARARWLHLSQAQVNREVTTKVSSKTAV